MFGKARALPLIVALHAGAGHGGVPPTCGAACPTRPGIGPRGRDAAGRGSSARRAVRSSPG